MSATVHSVGEPTVQLTCVSKTHGLSSLPSGDNISSKGNASEHLHSAPSYSGITVVLSEYNWRVANCSLETMFPHLRACSAGRLKQLRGDSGAGHHSCCLQSVRQVTMQRSQFDRSSASRSLQLPPFLAVSVSHSRTQFEVALQWEV